MNNQMEDLKLYALIVVPFTILVGFYSQKAYRMVWGRPKMLEKSLKRQGVDGTAFKPFTGDLKEFLKQITDAWEKPISLSHQIAQRVDPFTSTIVQKYGKVSFCWLGTTPRLIIMDVKMIKEVLTNKQGHIRKPELNPLITILTKGLTTLEGEKWAEHRRILNPAFHLEKLKGMIPVFVQCSAVLIKKWKDSMDREGSLEVDVWPEFQDLTGDVISQTAFGSNYESRREILKLQKELLKLVVEVMQSLYIPGFRYIPTKKNRRRKELNRMITSMLRELVEGKEEMPKNRETNEEHIILTLLLKQNDEEISHIGTSKTGNSRMTTDEIIEECKQFYLAGQETTASLLTWMVIVLAMHPEWQQKAREEVQQLCGDKDPDSEVISRLKIVIMILYEVLRLYPPVIALYQHTYEETKIGDLNVQSGVGLVLPILLVNRDPELWGEDAEEFKPERFSQGVSKASKDQTAAFLPFGWGPRTCIGQNFALIEAKVALAMMLKHFSFELSPSYTHAPYTVMTLQPQHGAPIILKLLQSST